MEREILTVEQAAEYLQIHKVTVYKYIRSGLLPAAKLGKVYRIYRKDVEALLDTLRTNGT
ncbi:MAG: helix-turn-helix domain-containing protein [Armatimonadetes bacterium]|nr:helix-turn-helix domain-containing protein [Armatimonadota bacterium]MBI2200444.1 helix-turn-helix domain-containing protein [Armatimonadota bacterium]MBI2246541.1 helix-turn-helix domain-containing protein [Armatimonadota bacterium]MBI2972275.1 helix-turn-helix domain-containing protein [Armatimonadota bacterium]